MTSKELETIKDSLTPNGDILEYTKEYKVIKKDLEELEWYRKLFNEPIQTLIKDLKILEILKPLCEVYETPVYKYKYLKVKGVVVYEFKSIEQFNLFKEWLDNGN